VLKDNDIPLAMSPTIFADNLILSVPINDATEVPYPIAL
jgi:hypothetical protein